MTTATEPSVWTQGLNHITIAVRNTEEAAAFWLTIFNGLPHRDLERGKRLAHILLGDLVLHFSEGHGLVGWDLEYPHYAFTVSSPNMFSLKARLDQANVPTHPIWTRNEIEGLMYFRDPTGNLFELYCPRLDGASDRNTARLARTKGGDFVPPVADLRYDWDADSLGALAESPDGQDRVTGLNHITLPVRDVDEAARFWTSLFDADVYKRRNGRPTHVRFSHGLVLHFSAGPGLVGWDLEYPHYAFTVASDAMFALKDRLDAAGVTTHPIWTRHQHEGLMYFRDPTGNLFELYCAKLDGADDPARVPIAREYGGPFHPPISALSYDWKG